MSEVKMARVKPNKTLEHWDFSLKYPKSTTNNLLCVMKLFL